MKHNAAQSILNDLLTKESSTQIAAQLHNIAKQLQIHNCIETAKLTRQQFETFQTLIKEVE